MLTGLELLTRYRASGNMLFCALLIFIAKDDNQTLCCVSLFRNQNRTSEEQLAYAHYYRNEEAAAIAHQLELVCLYPSLYPRSDMVLGLKGQG